MTAEPYPFEDSDAQHLDSDRMHENLNNLVLGKIRAFVGCTDENRGVPGLRSGRLNGDIWIAAYREDEDGKATNVVIARASELGGPMYWSNEAVIGHFEGETLYQHSKQNDGPATPEELMFISQTIDKLSATGTSQEQSKPA